MATKQSTTGASGDKQQHPTGDSVMRQLMYGRVVSSDFFARNWIVLLVIIFLILVYIAGKYTCQTKMEQVRRLETRLEVVKAERVRARSDYMSKIRESAMQQLVDTNHLGLKVQEYPPFILSKE